MSDFQRCKNCGKYDFIQTHKCSPEWEAIYYEHDDEDEPRRAFGYNAESAAVQLAEDNFASWEYPAEMEIWIRKHGDKDWQKFIITVETIPSFTATIKK